jgi:hypothetical protein
VRPKAKTDPDPGMTIQILCRTNPLAKGSGCRFNRILTRTHHYNTVNCSTNLCVLNTLYFMIGAQRNEKTLVHFKCVFESGAYLQLARLDRMNDADLSSLLLVLCTASADPWAVCQDAG